VKIANQATAKTVRQRPIHQCEGCEPARKCVEHDTARAEHARAIREERRIVIKMLRDGSGYDEIRQAVSKR